MINWRLPAWISLLLCLLFLQPEPALVAQWGRLSTDCTERPRLLTDILVYPYTQCLELVFHDTISPTLSFSALAVGDDGTLYATRPLYGELFAFEDTDGDNLPDSPRLVVNGLTLPNGLHFHDGLLYVSGGANIYRVDPASGTTETLVDDLPFGGGLWTGDLFIAPDERIYVGVSSPCDRCVPPNPEQGSILSFDLDGGDRQIVARGFRHPADITWHEGALWVTDTARPDLLSPTETERAWLDELNRIEPGGHYGFPYCLGAMNQPDLTDAAFDCREAIPATIPLPTQSNPVALLSYPGGSLPYYRQLLVLLGGSSQAADVRGYQLIALPLDETNQPMQMEIIMPYKPTGQTFPYILPYDFQAGDAPFDMPRQHNIIDDGISIYPHRPLDMASSREGWLYLSLSDGRLLALRPRICPFCTHSPESQANG